MPVVLNKTIMAGYRPGDVSRYYVYIKRDKLFYVNTIYFVSISALATTV